ncbi:MAG: hypothetical protein K2K57_07885 [Oscillospiraceae bacterium]|nr:hypothetical protein [Oscillospiraceae bacterium]
MVEKFTEWLKENKYKFKDSGFCDLDITYISPEKGGSGAIIARMDNDRYFCDINVRNDEIINIEAISSNENDTPFMMYGQVNKYVDFDNYMGSFFEFIGGGASGESLDDWLNKNSGKFKELGFGAVTEENSGDEKLQAVFKTERGKYICRFSVGKDNCISIEIEERGDDVLPFWIHLAAGGRVDFDKLMCNFFDFFKGDTFEHE